MFKNREHYYDSPLTYETRYITAGVGFNLSRYVTLDLAYQNVTDKQTKYRLFYSIENATGDFFTTTGLFDTKSKRHNVAMSSDFPTSNYQIADRTTDGFAERPSLCSP